MNSMIHKDSKFSIAFEQTKDKLYHHSNAFMYLLILHLIGYFFAGNSGISGGSGGDFFQLSYRSFSTTPLYVMTIFWMIFQGSSLAEEKSRQYYMVSNNFTAYFSDIAVLEIFALIGGVLTLFSGFLIQVYGTLFIENFVLHSVYGSLGVLHYLTLFITGTLYFLIFGTAAYFVGILRIRYRSRFILVAFVAAILLIVGGILAVRVFGASALFNIESLFRFYLDERNFFIWLIKVLFTIAGLYTVSYFGIKNMEVNR